MPSGEGAMTSRARTDPESGAQLSGFAQVNAEIAEHADLDVVFLQKICELVAGELPDVTVSFMGEGGRIVASSARSRLGDVHEGAARVMRGEADTFEVTAEPPAPTAAPPAAAAPCQPPQGWRPERPRPRRGCARGSATRSSSRAGASPAW